MLTNNRRRKERQDKDNSAKAEMNWRNEQRWRNLEWSREPRTDSTPWWNREMFLEVWWRILSKRTGTPAHEYWTRAKIIIDHPLDRKNIKMQNTFNSCFNQVQWIAANKLPWRQSEITKLENPFNWSLQIYLSFEMYSKVETLSFALAIVLYCHVQASALVPKMSFKSDKFRFH